MPSKKISDSQQQVILELLKKRFNSHTERHPDLDWKKVEEKLLSNPKKLSILLQMEATGGEPDVIDYDVKNDTYTFCDCSPESPNGRRSLCYDQKALDARKEHKPANSAVEMAKEIGIDLLTEAQYFDLQTKGAFDVKTSSWIKTPDAVRDLGGALFGDSRYERTFIYHNGAQSYYAARGFRGILKV